MNENSLNELLENLSISVYECSITTERKVLSSNTYMKDFLSLESEQDINIFDLVDDDSKEEYLQEFELMKKTKKSRNLAYAINLLNGKKKWVQDNMTPILDINGEIKSIYGVMTDITVQKKAETIMFDYNEALKQGIHEKTFELTKVNTELENINKMKDKFFSIIAHDLRGPFSGITKYIELIIDDKESVSKEEICEALQSIHTASKGLYQLMENLLSWAQLQNKNSQAQKSRIKVEKIFKEVKEAIGLNAQVKNIEIALEPTKELTLHGDYFMIKTAIYNLLTNAIKFTPEKGIIKLKSSLQNENVKIEVIDSGIGMSNEIKDNLFNIGSKNSRKGTNGEPGTGLGLLLTKEFIELNHGKIDVHSSPNLGTTFEILLPKCS
ncbi:ATP-binding protein [Halobacteriovorax sp. HLS]|uniref:PAS domain-containing sensor histidine kinase n=1 Tax=Halobacteriovorax sp. HLS TaxID=2234000 RepID=UPI000FDC46A4|nr:ATP-binding protein [Halobacteriovorax sp. HLS]